MILLLHTIQHHNKVLIIILFIKNIISKRLNMVIVIKISQYEYAYKIKIQ